MWCITCEQSSFALERVLTKEPICCIGKRIPHSPNLVIMTQDFSRSTSFILTHSFSSVLPLILLPTLVDGGSVLTQLELIWMLSILRRLSLGTRWEIYLFNEVFAMLACMVIYDFFRLQSWSCWYVFNPGRHRYERNMYHALFIKVAP